MKPTAKVQFSMATNASTLDADRLRVVIPHWLRTFAGSLTELTVVVDPTPPTGRIAALHGSIGSLDQVRSVLAEFAQGDSRVKVENLPFGDRLSCVLRKWFGAERPIRCQAGTPIAAFIAAFEAASGPLILRADCDMLFYESGWLDAAARALSEDAADLVEPAPCGGLGPGYPVVSTRALMIHAGHWRDRILPLRAARLTGVRRVHRFLTGRPTWLALEQMLAKEEEQGRIRVAHLPEALGCSLHVATRDQATKPYIPMVVASMEAGAIPATQRRAGQNFCDSAWLAIDRPTSERGGADRSQLEPAPNES